MSSDETRGSADSPYQSDKSRAVGRDADFNRIIDALIQEASLESHVTDSILSGSSVDNLVAAIGGQRTVIEADLRTRFPDEDTRVDAFTDEAVATLIRIAFDHGFRVGRLFEARGFEIEI